MKYLRKQPTKKTMKKTGKAKRVGGGLAPVPDAPSGVIGFDAANQGGPLPASPNDGVYAVTSNSISVTSAPTPGNRGNPFFYSGGGSTLNDLSYLSLIHI